MNIDWELAHSFTVDDGVGVRCACELPSTDEEQSYRVIVGTQGGALFQWTLPSQSLLPIGYQHDNGISAIISSADNNIYVTGCKDSNIRIFDGTTHELLRTCKGHDKPVSSLAWVVGGGGDTTQYLISGSWDGTAKVWNPTTGALIATLPNHENSACVTGLRSDEAGVLLVATGSAGIAQNNRIQDHSVRIWKINVTTGQVDLGTTVANDHQGPIRDIMQSANDGFLATCSNDGTVKLRSVDTGECLSTLAFPPVSDPPMLLSIASSATGTVAAAEDGHVVFWKTGEEPQLIRHAACVWQVLQLSNNDIATCCQDGYVRVFTQATDRIASEELRNDFTSAVLAATQKSSSGPSQEEVQKLPKWELNALQQGKKEGQVQLFQKTGVAIAAQWSMASQTWIEVGQVVSGDSDDNSGMIDGVKYDLILPIEVDQQGGGVAKLNIGYNTGENPFVASQRFIDSHTLPQHHLAEIADYIQQRVGTSGGPTIGAPSSTTAVAPAVYQHLPMRGFKYFDLTKATNFDKMLTKIGEVGQLSETEMTTLKELTDTLSQTSRYHATKVDPAAFKVLEKMLSWEPAQAFPALDLARLAVLHPDTPKSWNLEKMVSAAHALCDKDPDGVAVPMLMMRLIANCLKGPVEVLDLTQVMALTEKCVASKNKNVRLSVATVLLNVSSYLNNATPAPNNVVDVATQVVVQVNSILEAKSYESEAMVRALLSLGTVLLASDTKDVANSLFLANKVEFAASPHGDKAKGVAVEIYTMLQ